MSNDVLWNDDEKVELIKKWWKKNGNWAITAIIVALVAILGWQYWHRHLAKQATQASMAYEQMITSERTQPKATLDIANEIKKNYSGSPYADYAAFTLASIALQKNNYSEAEQQFKWVISHSNVADNQQLAHIRLARVFIANQQPQKAIETLNDENLTIYPGLAQLIAGDAYLALNNIDLARKSYQKALANIEKNAPLFQLVQMKLNALPSQGSQ
jgi:predicted negative regulator of RcsB-dependent stress response